MLLVYGLEMCFSAEISLLDIVTRSMNKWVSKSVNNLVSGEVGLNVLF